MTRLLVTGANGHLGRRLCKALAADAGVQVRAVVRSTPAARALGDRDDVRVVDYADVAGLIAAGAECEVLVHLVGILRESAAATYQAAHEQATRGVLEAATAVGIRRIVYLSILGADERSPNRCLASKARAETLLLGSPIPSLVLRVPMVLGEGDHAARALLANAARKFAVTFRAASLEQPIYAGDVIAAIRAGLNARGPTGILELAGPRSLTRRELIAAASEVGTRVVSLPVGLGYALAGLASRLLANPPLTRDMLEILDHDDRVDPEPAANALGIRLTSLAETLARIKAGTGS